LGGRKEKSAAMRESVQGDYRTTIETFHAFVDDRPEEEKWELIDGEIVLNPTATNWHQVIVGTLIHELHKARDTVKANWQILPGIGTRVPDDPHNEPVPDVMVIRSLSEVSNWTFDALVTFEVLSPYSLRRDMVRKRAFYARIDKLTHYIVLAQDRQEATVFARSNGFEPQILNAANSKIEIEPLSVSIPLADIYRDVPLG
jgi:Uma2 family endonuclease